jgi:hypothetical protein
MLTAHVPGVHVIEIVLAAPVVAVPEHVCGPVSEILESLVTLAVKRSKGAANASAQLVCVTTTLCPIKEASQ